MKCFEYHEKTNLSCEKVNCRYWIKNKESQMCCINLIEKKDNFTLENIGELFSVTRMRICQIEKRAIEKIKSITLSII